MEPQVALWRGDTDSMTEHELTALATAVAGIVGFVGLVVPHVLRLVFGPAHHTRSTPDFSITIWAANDLPTPISAANIW